MIFIALTLARSPKKCFTSWPRGLVFKQLSWDLADLMHDKTTCLIPILYQNVDQNGVPLYMYLVTGNRGITI